jgi:hypothetical protein
VWIAIYFLGKVAIHVYSENLNQIGYNHIMTDILLSSSNSLYGK